MKTPIKRAGIRTGDLIRAEYLGDPDGAGVHAIEYTAEFNGHGNQGTRWFLLDRPVPPVVLPTEIGAVISWKADNDADTGTTVFAERISADEWRVNGFDLYDERMVASEIKGVPFVRLEPVADTAKRIIERLNAYVGDSPDGHRVNTYDLSRWVDDLAAELGVK